MVSSASRLSAPQSRAPAAHEGGMDNTPKAPAQQLLPQRLALDDAPFPSSYAEALVAAIAFTAAALLLIAGMGGVVFACMTMSPANIWQLAIWVMVALFSMPLALWTVAVCTSMMVLALQD